MSASSAAICRETADWVKLRARAAVVTRTPVTRAGRSQLRVSAGAASSGEGRHAVAGSASAAACGAVTRSADATLDAFASIARDFRAAHGFRLRIATKYHRLVRAFLSDHEVADYQLVDSQGATEGTVANLTAEAIADITSTGETLRANHLKILPDALIHASQATLVANRRAMETGTIAPIVAHLGLPPHAA